MRHHEQLTRKNFLRSLMVLGIEITFLARKRNLLPPAAADKGGFFLDDSSIPLPRPLTALAWASICTLGPIMRVNPAEDIFILPMLPRLLFDDAHDSSLPRMSKAHIRDVSNQQIIWGPVYFGDSRTALIGRSDRGDLPLSNLIRCNDLFSYKAGSLPPAWSDFDSGWEAGIIQGETLVTMNARTPWEMLAQHGIPISIRNAGYWPGEPIRRLLFRITAIESASEWAVAYAQAQREFFSDSSHMHLIEDWDRFKEQINVRLAAFDETASENEDDSKEKTVRASRKARIRDTLRKSLAENPFNFDD